MLTVLRKIRRRLFSGNKLTGYLAYAIGEIVLVVIGIMIAIQLNNWNEQTRYRADLVKGLEEMRQDMQEDSVYLNRSRRSLFRQRRSAFDLKDILPTDVAYHDSIGQKFSQVSFYFGFEIKRATYESIRERLLSPMRNDALRIAIDEYYFEMHRLYQTNSRYSMGVYWRENIYPKYFKSFDWGGASEPVDYPALRDNPEIFVALDYVLNDSRYYLQNVESAIQQNTEILALIRGELE